MYTHYSAISIFCRRTFVILLAMICLPVLLLIPVNKRTVLTSYMYRCWSQTSTKPLWLSQLERSTTHRF